MHTFEVKKKKAAPAINFARATIFLHTQGL